VQGWRPTWTAGGKADDALSRAVAEEILLCSETGLPCQQKEQA